MLSAVATIRAYDPGDLGANPATVGDRQAGGRGRPSLDIVEALELMRSNSAIALVADGDGDAAHHRRDGGAARLDGRMIGPGLWDGLKGLADAKRIIERRVRARTDDFVAAIRETRPTLSEEIVESVRGDVRRFARD